MQEDAGDQPQKPAVEQAAPETEASESPTERPRSEGAENQGAKTPTGASESPAGTAEASSEQVAGASEGGAPKKRRRRRRRRRSSETSDAESPSQESEAGTPTEASSQPAAEGAQAADSSSEPTGKKKARKRKRKPKSKTGHEASADGGPSQRRDKPRKDRGRSRGEAPSRGGRGSKTHAAAAIRELAAMTKDLLDAEDVPFLARPRHLLLELRVPLDLERDGSKAAEQVVTQLLRRVQEVRAHESALKPGSVYCYFHESAEAATSRPNSVREVFDGYGSTGRPVFTDFVTMAVERRDEELQRMLDGEDLVLTHVSMGHILRTEQLAAFGKQSPIYRVLGQVDAGLYTLTGSDQQAAFSFQLLRGRTLDGAPRFRLHWVSGADLRDVADPNLALILGRFQQSLDQASLRFQGLESNGDAPDEEEFVRPFLVDLAKRLKGRAKRGARRTGHATERADTSQRPTSKAFEDAKNAGDDSVLRDDEQGTIVIAGPKNRVHVFTPEAKHVTSFVMNGHNLQMRKREGRWLPSEPEDRGEFRIALRARLEAGDTETSEETV